MIAESKDISRFRLTQPQISTIVLAGVVGQYPIAPIVGSMIDRIGPWICSLLAAVLFSTGFGFFSYEFRAAEFHKPSNFAFWRLVFFYLLCGLGTVSSYFSSLFSASKNFPQYSGIAAGFSMALFGLSPLILSFIASTWFMIPERGLDVANYTASLAVLTVIIHLIGAITLRIEPPAHQEPADTSDSDSNESDPESETSALLPKKLYLGKYDSFKDVLRDHHFWILALVSLLVLGSCEMVVTNIGTISLALPSREAETSAGTLLSNSTIVHSAATTQVRLLSFSNTISRITTGPMADFISPVASYLPSGLVTLPREHRISRVVFLFGSCILMILSFLWMIFVVQLREQIWLFSIGIGTAYGSTFTVLPSLLASIWGTATLARNFGMISYSPFVGTSLFSYLYAFITSAMTETKDKDGYSEGACIGKRCWQSTFSISAASGVVAACLSLLLWKRWKGRL